MPPPPVLPRISDDVLSLKEALVELRRDLHRHPELAFQETRTAARVAAFLEGAGLDVRTGLGGTGVLATARGGDGPTVLLRVDMDALPLQEQNEAPYRVDGRRGDARLRPRRPHRHGGGGGAGARRAARCAGEVRMLFQPAEEGEGGAQAVVKDGALEGVDVVLGVHLWNELAVGTLGVKAGPLMAAVDRLTITVRGQGGHGGKPHRAADPVVAAAHVVTALQTIVSREVAPVDSAVVTIGAIHGGQAFNVIPDEVELLGTIRTFDPALRAHHAGAHRAASPRGSREAMRCEAEVAVTNGNPAVINDPKVAALARRAAARVVGEDEGRGARSPPWAARTWPSTSRRPPAASCSWAPPTPPAASTTTTTTRASTSTRTPSPSAASSWCRRRRRRCGPERASYCPDLGVQRRLVHPAPHDLVADAGLLRHRDRAPRRDRDRRVDQVLLEVARAGRGVAGQGEAGQGLQVDVVEPADARLQHAPAPHGHAALPAVALDGQGLGVAAHPSHLDVDDAAGAEVEGVAGVVQAVDRLVEADGRADLLLQRGVVHDVVPGQGLLDHHELVGGPARGRGARRSRV